MDPYVPMPNTEHPHYASQAAGIRKLVNERRMAVTVMEVPRLIASYDESEVLDVKVRPVTLEIKKIAGPAPFVGDPRIWQGWYYWYAAVDSAGRHVAGEATLGLIPI